MRIRPLALLGLILAAAPASAQTNVADYNLNPLSRAYASDSGAYDSKPSGAINGNTYAYYAYDGNFYHSGSNNAWWYVDLGASYDISRLQFYYRQDCCPYQSDGDFFRIWASTPDFSNPLSAAYTANINSSSPAYANVGVFTPSSPVTGRYVSLQAVPGQSIVAAEVEVYAVPAGAIATPEPASFALLATGLAGIVGIARRKKRNVA